MLPLREGLAVSWAPAASLFGLVEWDVGPGVRGTEDSAVGDVSQVLRPKKSQDDDDEEKVVVTDYSEEKLEATEVLASEGPGRGGRHGTKCSYIIPIFSGPGFRQ